MHKHTIWILVLFCFYGTTFAQIPLRPEETTVLKEKIAGQMKRMQSLESDFTQTKQLSYLDDPVKSSGKLYYKAPSKIRWEYTAPETMVTVYDLDAPKRSKDMAGALATTIIGGDALDENRFDISYYQEGNTYPITLKPKEKALRKYVERIELLFDANTLLLKQLKITEPTQDYTLIVFEHQRTDAPIADDKFMTK